MSKAKQDQTRLGVMRVELGASLHTALRKCCDSDPTSLAWNLINLDGMTKAWGEYLDLAWQHLKGSTADAAPTRLREAAAHMEYGSHGRACLKLTFQSFSEDDWKGFAAYLEDEK